jgi:hypothetical protein
VTVKILFLLTLCIQQLRTAAMAVKAIIVRPRDIKTRESFQKVGKTTESVESPSMAKTAQFLTPFIRVHLLKTPTEGAPVDTAVPFSETNIVIFILVCSSAFRKIFSCVKVRQDYSIKERPDLKCILQLR